MAKVKNLALSASAIALLVAIGTASANDETKFIPNTEDAKALLDAKLIQVDTTNVNDEGAAASLTDEGKAMFEQNKGGAAGSEPGGNDTSTGGTENAGSEGSEASAPKEKPKFEIFTMDAIPPQRRASPGAQAMYPFDDLAAPVDGKPAAFFVPATPDRPEPWKSMGSTVSGAKARYARKVGDKPYKNAAGEEKTRAVYEYDRDFRLTRGKRVVDGKEIEGAFVARVK